MPQVWLDKYIKSFIPIAGPWSGSAKALRAAVCNTLFFTPITRAHAHATITERARAHTRTQRARAHIHTHATRARAQIHACVV